MALVSSARSALVSLSLAVLTACGARSLTANATDDLVVAPVSPGSPASSPPASSSPSSPPASSSPSSPGTTKSDPPFVWSWTFTRGSRAVGDGCAFGAQCLSGVCSAEVSAGECGRCVEVQELGESCEGALQGCYPSARCEAGVCTSLRKTLGEACALGPKGDDEDECDFAFYCDGKPGKSHGVCVPRHALGEACEGPYGGVPCRPGDVCVKGRCVANEPGAFGKLGGECFSGQCQLGLECLEGYVCGPGTLAIGAPCGVVDGLSVPGECAPGTICGNLDWPDGGGGPGTLSTCVALPLEGAPCVHDRCAEGLFCRWREDHPGGTSAKVCERPRELGEACSTLGYGAIQCAAGLECRLDVCSPACP